MIGELNSLCVRTGEVIGDGIPSVALIDPVGSLGLPTRRGEDGALGSRPGEGWRCEEAVARLGNTRLWRFRSRDRVLATRLRDIISALGESTRLRPPDAMEECILPSLSAPASLSIAIEPRFWRSGGSMGPICDLGVAAPWGLLALEEPPEEARRLRERSDALRNAMAIADG